MSYVSKLIQNSDNIPQSAKKSIKLKFSFKSSFNSLEILPSNNFEHFARNVAQITLSTHTAINNHINKFFSVWQQVVGVEFFMSSSALLHGISFEIMAQVKQTAK